MCALEFAGKDIEQGRNGFIRYHIYCQIWVIVKMHSNEVFQPQILTKKPSICIV